MGGQEDMFLFFVVALCTATVTTAATGKAWIILILYNMTYVYTLDSLVIASPMMLETQEYQRYTS